VIGAAGGIFFQGGQMTQVFTILGFVAKLAAIEADMKITSEAIVAKACELVAAEARRVLGEGYPEWPALQPSTLARKIGPGPLLETGELQASIEWHAEGLHGEVGSNNDKAVWHEFGTSKIPPRSFLAGAAVRMGPEIEKLAARAVRAVMLGKGLNSSEMREFMHALHIIRHVGHAVKEATDKALETDEERARRR
jgi:phage gpG-like protein